MTPGSLSVLDLCLRSTWNLRITERVFNAEVDEEGLIKVGVMGKVRFLERPILQRFRKTFAYVVECCRKPGQANSSCQLVSDGGACKPGSN